MSTEHSATMTSGGIGQPVRRKEDFRLLTGNGCYTDDAETVADIKPVLSRPPQPSAVSDPDQTEAYTP